MQAMIFDMDGVLCDSEPVICAAATAMFAEKGVTVQPEDFLPFVGAGENRYIGGVAEKYGVELDLETDKARTYELYLEMVPGRIEPLPGVRELVEGLRADGVKVAVASSADLVKVAANLRAIGLPAANWDAVVNGLDIEHKKPAPDIFLLAAERLGVDPAGCVVVEDAVNGVQAAKAAGMYCIAVLGSFSCRELAGADLIVENTGDIDPASLPV